MIGFAKNTSYSALKSYFHIRQTQYGKSIAGKEMRFMEGLGESDHFGKPFQGVDPGKPLDGFGNFLVFRLKQMFEMLIVAGNKFL